MTATLDSIAEQIRAGRIEEAESALNTITATDENRAQFAFVRGMVRESQYDMESAYTAYNEAMEADPDHLEAPFRAARMANMLGDDDQAIELYEKCAHREETNVNALINLAIMYEDQNRLDEAENCLRHVLAEDPGHIRARQFLRSVECSYNMVYDERQAREREKRDAVLDTPITDFELSVRSRNCLKQMNINSLGDLLRTTEAELLSYKNFGETSLNEIKAMLSQKGLRLGQSLQAPSQTRVAPPSVPGAMPGAPGLGAGGVSPGGLGDSGLGDGGLGAGGMSPGGMSPGGMSPGGMGPGGMGVGGAGIGLGAPMGAPPVDMGAAASILVSTLELSVRSRKCLQRLGITTLGDLAMRTEAELSATRNFGDTSLNEIKRAMAAYGVSFRPS